jgi:predicted anti-sigma-YlaC factor YlaD
MSECERLSDRMPMIAQDQAEWTPDEIQHLGECQSCRREWDLVQLVNQLGVDQGLALDPTAIAARVVRRLELERQARRRRRSWTFSGLAAVAAMVAVVWAGGLKGGVTHVPPAGTAVATRISIPLPELETLEPVELDSVLQTMDESILGGPTGEEPALGDLNNDELERVLNSWEG